MRTTTWASAASGLALALLTTLGSAPGCNRQRGTTPQAGTKKKTQSKPAAAADCKLEDRTGARAPRQGLDGLKDPVVDKVLRGIGDQGCPQTFAQVQAKLRKTDAQGCSSEMFEPVQTILVSERAQLRRTAQGTTEGCKPDPIAVYRGVTSRTCGGRPAHGLLAAVFGLTIHDDALPDDAELIGFDQTAGVFNYYSLESGTWHFHGSSIDMLQGPTKDGKRRCAACHVGGGLVLKEMRSPWVFWEGRDTLPGVTEILDAHPDLGSRSGGKVLDLRPAGKELEEAIEAGNRAWTKTRVRHLQQEGTIRELLRPLFCTTEIELMAASQSVSPPASSDEEDGTLTLEADALLIDPRLGTTSRIPIPVTTYHQALRNANHRVERTCGAVLEDSQGNKVRDTAFDLLHPFRSTSDDLVVGELIEQGVVDEKIVQAVMAVDLTRPVFSTTRCGLLDLLPETPARGRDAAWVRDTLQQRASETGDERAGARELATYLGGERDPVADASRFVKACADRPAPELIADVLREVSRRRDMAREMPIIEMQEMLPRDDLRVKRSGGLDPRTCRFEQPAKR